MDAFDGQGWQWSAAAARQQHANLLAIRWVAAAPHYSRVQQTGSHDIAPRIFSPFTLFTDANCQVCISCVAINCNFRQVSGVCFRIELSAFELSQVSYIHIQDESYTPSLISIRTGTHLNDLQETLKVRGATTLPQLSPPPRLSA